jgi:hypothetical protein
MTTDAEIDDPVDQPDETEAKARKMGWRPKEEYRGAVDKWVEAGEFLRQTEEEFPRLKHANQTLIRTVERLEKGQQEIIAHQERQLAQTRKEAYEQAQRDIEARHKQAVIAGDVEGADKALKAAQELKVRAETPPPENKINTADQEAVKDWVAENQWFATDPVLADYAKKYESHLTAQGVPLAERLKKTTEYIKRKFPAEFAQEDDMDDPAPRMINNRNGMRQPKAKPKYGTYEALTAEGRTACDRFVSANPGNTKAKAEWLKFATPDLFIQ